MANSDLTNVFNLNIGAIGLEKKELKITFYIQWILHLTVYQNILQDPYYLSLLTKFGFGSKKSGRRNNTIFGSTI